MHVSNTVVHLRRDMLTELEFFLAPLITGYDPREEGGDEDSFLYSHYKEEFTLWYGSVLFTVFLFPFVIPAGWIGQQIGGRQGHLVGGDIAFGVIAFGGAGVWLHTVRAVALRLYWVVTVRSLTGPDPYPRPPPPPRRIQWLMASTSGDVVFQVLCGIAVAVVLIRFQP
jgi:hypothetical protein